MRFAAWFKPSRSTKPKELAIPLRSTAMSHQPAIYDKTPRYEVNETTVDEISRPRSSHRKNRRSFFGGRADEIQALPPMPPMPTTTATNTSTADKRRSTVSVKSVKRSSSMKRMSFWASSNPDESDSEIPPVPALSRGASLETVDSARSAAPTQVKRKSYVPRSAAKSFLVTTSGASEDKRKSYRRSFKLDEDADLVCLTQEQQLEWAKLMNARDLPTTTTVSERPGTAVGGGKKFANDQALAALEFGPLR